MRYRIAEFADGIFRVQISDDIQGTWTTINSDCRSIESAKRDIAIYKAMDKRQIDRTIVVETYEDETE